MVKINKFKVYSIFQMNSVQFYTFFLVIIRVDLCSTTCIMIMIRKTNLYKCKCSGNVVVDLDLN